MDSGEEDDDDDEKKTRRGPILRAGGLKERMGKENPSGRYILHDMYLPTYLT